MGRCKAPAPSLIAVTGPGKVAGLPPPGQGNLSAHWAGKPRLVGRAALDSLPETRVESITGRRPFLAAFARGFTERDWIAFAVGVAILGALVVADIALGRTAVLVGVAILAPFVGAVAGALWATVCLGVLTVGFGLASPLWNLNIGEPDHWIRVGGLVVGAIVAVVGAWAGVRARLNAMRLETLDEIGAIADGSLPLDETLRKVTELIAPAAADICIVDAISGGGSLRAAVGVAGHPGGRNAEIEAGIRARSPSYPNWLIRPEPAWRRLTYFRPRLGDEDLARMAQAPGDLAFLRAIRPRCSISVPMLARDVNLGVLTLICAWSGRRYGDDDVRFAQILAGRVALALDNAGLFSDLESVERRMDAVMANLADAVTVHDARGELVYANPAAARWAGYSSPEELMAAPAEALRSRFALFSERGERLGGTDAIGERLRAGRLPWRQLLRVVRADSGEERWAMVRSEPVRGAAGELLYAVTTIEDATEVKRAEFTQRLLAGTGELLASSIDYRETLRRVARVAVPQFADWCAVNLPRDDGGIEQVAIAHTDPERTRLARDLRERDPVHVTDADGVARVIRTGEPLIVRKATEEMLRETAEDDDHLRLLREAGSGSAIVVPMRAGARILGALAFVNERESRAFDDADLEIALEIARRAGLAIENARLASEQADVAQVLQRGLLPPELPDMPGWTTATMYRPAGEVNEVGGDFYDAFEVEGGWMIVVGDVVGRGARAASLTALARYTIRTAGMIGGSPHAVLRYLDSELRERSETPLCSVVLALLPDTDLQKAEVRLVSAGHPPPLLLSEGRVEEIECGGPMLGTVDSPVWKERLVNLGPGDQIVLHTDGVTEAAGPGDRFGEERLRERLAGASDPAAAVSRIGGALDAFVEGPPGDDAAAVAIMRTGAADEAGAGRVAAAAEGTP
jgi:PAS domain S-box-containing protein